ncbi:MAG: TonB-dependent receptor [Pseudomonadota bacterium]
MRLILGVALVASGTVASAQNAVEEVMVSATRRAENIQDVPISVNSVSADQIEKFGIVDIEDLSLYVPNFEINSSTVLPNLYIRGMGSGATHSIEQSVGRFVDDVYIGRAAINLHGFMDVAGVEVLRGPQGTLFGKNTVGGALIVRTGDPTDDFESGVSLSASGYSTAGGTREAQGFFSGPLTDNLSGRVAVRMRERDGFYINRLEGPDGSDRNDSGIRVKLAWTPTDRTSVGLKLEFNEYEEEGADAAEISDIGGPPLSVYQIASPNFTPELDWMIDVDCTDIIANRDTTGDGLADTETNTGSFCPQRDQESINATVRVEHDFESGTLTSISAFQKYEYLHQFPGLDMGLAGAFRATRNEEYEGFSQEFRFTSEASDTFDYIVGAYFEDSTIDRFQNSDINLVTIFQDPTGGFIGRFEPWTQDTQTFAAFGQLRYTLTDELRLIVGGRFANESKDFAFERFFAQYGTSNRLDIPNGPGGPPLVVTDDRSESKFTGSVTLQYDRSDNSMLYGGFSQGHKTGGFSDRIEDPTVSFEYQEEDVNAVEFGAKTFLLDGALSLNIAVFYMDIQGLQLATQLPGDVPAFSVSNAADSTSQGIEIDSLWAVNDIWNLGASVSFTDATHDSFPGAECFPGTPVTPDPVTGSCDLAGLPLIFAPDLKVSLWADFEVTDVAGGWDLGGRVDYAYSSEFYTDISYQDNVLTDSYSLINASLRLIAPNDRITVSLLGRNLTEEAYCAWCIPSGPNILATMNPPREIGLRVTARFD